MELFWKLQAQGSGARGSGMEHAGSGLGIRDCTTEEGTSALADAFETAELHPGGTKSHWRRSGSNHCPKGDVQARPGKINKSLRNANGSRGSFSRDSKETLILLLRIQQFPLEAGVRLRLALQKGPISLFHVMAI